MNNNNQAGHLHPGMTIRRKEPFEGRSTTARRAAPIAETSVKRDV